MSDKISCSTIVESEEGILLVGQETDGEMRFSLPGGKPKPREDLMCTAIRETFEETGVLVDLEGVVQFQDFQRTRAGNRILRVIFLAVDVGGQMAISDAHPIVGFYDRDEIKDLRQGGYIKPNGTLEAIRAYRRGQFCDLDVLNCFKRIKPSRTKTNRLIA